MKSQKVIKRTAQQEVWTQGAHLPKAVRRNLEERGGLFVRCSDEK